MNWFPFGDARIEIHYYETSGQDGGISRYTLPPCTTKRRTATHLKTKNNQNCQKVELYGNLTTKQLIRNIQPDR